MGSGQEIRSITLLGPLIILALYIIKLIAQNPNINPLIPEVPRNPTILKNIEDVLYQFTKFPVCIREGGYNYTPTK